VCAAGYRVTYINSTVVIVIAHIRVLLQFGNRDTLFVRETHDLRTSIGNKTECSTIDWFPSAFSVRSANFSGTFVVVIASFFGVLYGAFWRSWWANGDGLACSEGHVTFTSCANWVFWSTTVNGAVYSAFSRSGTSGFIITLVCVARIVLLFGSTSDWSSGAAHRTIVQYTRLARAWGATSVRRKARTTDTESTATTTRRYVLITSTSNQFKIVGSKFCEIISAQNTFRMIISNQNQFFSGDVTIGTDTNGVNGDFIATSKLVEHVGICVSEILCASGSVVTAFGTTSGWVPEGIVVSVSNDDK